MPDYSKGKVYKIISNESEAVYIGSTTQLLCSRISGHRRDYRRYVEGVGVYISSFEILQYPDAKIVLVESCPCNTKEELLRKEQHYIDSLNCCNKNNAYSECSVIKEYKIKIDNVVNEYERKIINILKYNNPQEHRFVGGDDIFKNIIKGNEVKKIEIANFVLDRIFGENINLVQCIYNNIFPREAISKEECLTKLSPMKDHLFDIAYGLFGMRKDRVKAWSKNQVISLCKIILNNVYGIYFQTLKDGTKSRRYNRDHVEMVFDKTIYNIINNRN